VIYSVAAVFLHGADVEHEVASTPRAKAVFEHRVTLCHLLVAQLYTCCAHTVLVVLVVLVVD
jgi:hypothetical protein